jgi:hypothetical protein
MHGKGRFDATDRLGLVPPGLLSCAPTPAGPIRVIGAYVPSWDASPEKTQRKRQWMTACRAALTGAGNQAPTILLAGKLGCQQTSGRREPETGH